MTQENTMSEDQFNISMRKFLKSVGVTSQQKIEEAVRNMPSDFSGQTVSVTVTLEASNINLKHQVTGEIELP